jgi:DNA-binding NtrC family response regulator
MSKTAFKLNILYCESDEEVLASHAPAMTKAGHQVHTAQGRKAAEEALKKGSFDLVVLGSSLSKNDRHHLPYMVKKSHEGTRVLVCHTGGHHHEVDATVDGERGVTALLEKIATLMSESAALAK